MAGENDGVAVEGATVITGDDKTNSDAVDTGKTVETTDEGGDAGKTDDTAGVTGDDSQLAPETYADFTLPEGVELDTALLTDAAPLFKELGLTQEQAQKLVDLQVKQTEASGVKQADAFNQQLNDWLDESKADKEFGGDAFDENAAVAKAGLNAFGSQEFKDLLDNTGLGNHPEVIRFMVKVGSLVQEDSPGNGNGAPTKTDDAVSILYPNDRKE